MEEITVTVHCSLCEKKHDEKVLIPNGWKCRNDGADIEDGFCPDHRAVYDFANDQCPGCVGSWGECPLFYSFAYSGRVPHGEEPLTEADHDTLRAGRCPRRVNGTISFDASAGIEEIDLSTPARNGGEALSEAIKEYIKRYNTAA